MIAPAQVLKCIVAAIVASLLVVASAAAEEDELTALFEGLKTADEAAARQIEERIQTIWSQSGSPAMDLLLERGREALTEGDTTLAIEHFTALIDHAPDFAEGYNARATAYFQNRQYGPSLEDIRRTLALNPQHFGAISGLAIILEELGMKQQALEAWREVASIHPQREGVAEAVERLSREIEGRTL